MEDVIFENLHSLVSQGSNKDFSDDVIADDEVAALKCNHICFGDVYVNEQKQLLFTMKNQSKSDCYRFEWPALSLSLQPHNNQANGMNSNTASGVVLQTATQSESNISDNTAISFHPRVGHLHAGTAKDITVTFRSSEPKLLKKELFQATLCKITFEEPINEVKDWDDRMTVIKWINEYSHNNNNNSSEIAGSLATSSQRLLGGDQSAMNLPGSVLQGNTSQATHLSSKQIVRKKVVEVEPEPRHQRSEEACMAMELFVSGNCDYAKYKCRTSSVRFKDTLMFQTRVYEVSVANKGRTQFDFNWRVIMEDSRRPFTPFIQQGEASSPDSSPSPERIRTVRKSGRAKDESSVSPGRNKKELKDTKKELKKTLKDSQTSTKQEMPQPSTEPIKSQPAKPSTNKAVPAKNPMTKIETKTDLLEASLLNALPEADTEADMLTIRPESTIPIRAESSLSQHPQSIMAEAGYIPFSVEPAFGKIEPGTSKNFKVKFSPLDINDYQARLLCQIPNAEDGRVGPMIAVKGRGLLPYCHFDLAESDYIVSGRRDPDLPGPGGAASGLGLDPSTRVIEFECVGIGSRVVKMFDIINPTNQDYDFEWTIDESIESHLSKFICRMSQGTLFKGKKCQISIEFNSDHIGIIEEFWNFRIPKYELSISFLLVGHTIEPKCIFDRSHIMFKPLLLGRKGREVVNLINQENRDLEFAFDQTSCYTEGRSSVVIIEPSHGKLAGNSKQKIVLEFQPREQRHHVFNLKCQISNSSKPLNLNIKGEGFSMLSSLYCEDSVTTANIEFSDTMINEIHMGEVEKNEACIRNLYVFNTGKHMINFEWFLSSQSEESLKCFSIEPQAGVVGPGDRLHCILKYTAR